MWTRSEAFSGSPILPTREGQAALGTSSRSRRPSTPPPDRDTPRNPSVRALARARQHIGAPMTQTASEIVVGAEGATRGAPVGTAAPTDPTSADSATWKELGFASDAGVKLHDAKTLVNIKAWQSRYTVRRIVTDHDFTAAFSLIQWDKVTVPLAF